MLSFVLLSLFACQEKDAPDSGNAFNRETLLLQVADAMILPVFDSLALSAERLNMQLNAFITQPDQASLLAAQNAWSKAFLHFQVARIFSFGPSETDVLGDLSENLGTWPIDTSGLESRIQASDSNMKDFRRDTRGFLALEYVLFEPQTMARFQGPDAAKRSRYLYAVSSDILDWSRRLKIDWLAYSPNFKKDSGKSAGSSTSELYNHWLQSYELIKNYKVALPAGLQVGQTAAVPSLVESNYAHLSIRSIKIHQAAIEALWYGKGMDGQEGIGFDDYLLKSAGGEALRNAIIAQWGRIHTVLDPIDENSKLSELVVNEPETVLALFTELQKMTRYIKGDMSSLLGIAITYSSSDGD